VAERARPTLRCLHEDLELAVPRVDVPLEDVAHPLLVKAAERFAGEQAPQKRMVAIVDRIRREVVASG
jgi:hypothetical protein